MKRIKLRTWIVNAGICLLSASVFAAATPFDKVQLKGCTDKENPVGYKVGEPIVFTLRTDGLDAVPMNDRYRVRWERTGDDGKVEKGEIYFDVNAHGYDLGRQRGYYNDFFSKISPKGQQYAFSKEENADPDTAYFHGMALRVLGALEFMKTRVEWNGKDLIVEGGNQGGLQTSWAAGLDKDVTLARPLITWGCNLGFVDGKRIRGPWHIPWAPGLGYYDAVSQIARAKCPVEISRAGLGDYTCPPSGLALFYNAIKAPKSITWVQGSRHGHTPVGDNQVYVEKSAKRK